MAPFILIPIAIVVLAAITVRRDSDETVVNDKRARWMLRGALILMGMYVAIVHNGKVLNILRGHTGLVWPVLFSPSGCWLATGSQDETVRLWGVAE